MKLRNLSLEIFAAAFGYRCELDIVPFRWAKPQVGFSPGLGRKKRLPAFKLGPLHFWVMTADRVEIGLGADFRAHYHSTVFQRVYPNSFVWPDYHPISCEDTTP